jgi:hypothetical protein
VPGWLTTVWYLVDGPLIGWLAESAADGSMNETRVRVV